MLMQSQDGKFFLHLFMRDNIILEVLKVMLSII